ncbi:MAG TPA: sulfite exporter TauE/SafE family protein [Pseudogracilibacillus sp.]|nr:sulfite exporter TauE/SafE family protein [Pseudogracilibacillus sp.]
MDILFIVIVIALVIGYLAAFIGSLVGLGGGIVLVPSMLFLSEYVPALDWATPQTIVGISLVTMVFTGLSSSIAYMRLRRVDVQMGVLFLIGSIPGSILGSWLNSKFDVSKFSLYFGILMIVIFLFMLIDREKLARNRQPKITKKTRTFELDGKTYQYNVPIIPALILAVAVGMLSGLFGIGGGTISVPAMILLFGIPVQVAIGTSMFIILFISIVSSSTHIFLGNIEWAYVAFFVVGSYLGGTSGARVSTLFKGKTLEWFLRIVILIAAVRLMIDGLS